jgi:Protein of unknown function (DUF3043)
VAFWRKPADPAAEAGAAGEAEPASADSPTSAAARSRGYTPSKQELGKVTPKRSMAGRRAVEAPPANRREAMRRARLKQRQARMEARAGMMAGKEEYLLPRDKGAERALVRDLVDSRRNIATYFLPGALIVIIASSQAMPAPVRYGANILWALLAVGFVVDSILLSRRVRRIVAARIANPRGRNTWYAIMRSVSFRRMRMPAPQVKVGEPV